ncbi:MAG: tetratricopeptide repeat protein [bacterium]|nr:tetratricopeptide repeat protein [bacterium]
MELKTKKLKKNDFELLEKAGFPRKIVYYIRKYRLYLLAFLGILLVLFLAVYFIRSSRPGRRTGTDKAYVILSYNKILYQSDKIKTPAVREAIEAYETGYLEKAKFLFNSALQQNIPGLDRKAALVNLANIFDDLSQYELALNYLAQARLTDKRDNIIYHNQGIVYKHKKEYGKAVESFLLAVKYDRRFVRSYLSLASLYYYQKDIDSSLACYRKAEALHPENSEIKYNIAICLLKKRKTDEATRYLEQMIDADNISEKIRGEAAKSLGVYYAAKGNYEKALFYFTKASRFREDYDLYHKLGLLYKLMGKYKESLESFIKAHELNSKNTMTMKNLAELYFRFGENEKALMYYQYLVQSTKAEAETFLMMAEIYYRAGDNANAVLSYKKSIEVSPTPDEAKIACMNLGNIYYESKDYMNSLAYYNKALEIDRSDPNIYYNISLIYLKNNDQEGALRYINDIMKINPDDLKNYLLKARIMTQAGKMDEAVLEYEKIIERFPRELMPYFELANLYFRKRQLEKTEHYYKLLLDLKPEKSYLYKINLNLAILYGRMNDPNRALDYAGRAYMINPRDGLVNYNYGLLYMEKKEYDRALDLFHQVLRLNTDDPLKALASLSIANIYFYQGKYSLSESMCEKALKFDPRLTEAHYNLKVLKSRHASSQNH